MKIDLDFTGSQKLLPTKIFTHVYMSTLCETEIDQASEGASEVMSERRPSDSCRICKSSFKVKFGSIPGKQLQVYSSSQILFKPSQRKVSGLC